MKATITATANETRVLVQDASGDRLLARLPSLTCAAHPRALPSFMEALALWCGTKVRVVLYVDERFSWEQSGLSDTFGFGLDTLFLEVEVVPLDHRRNRRAKRLTGLGSFARERSAPRTIPIRAHPAVADGSLSTSSPLESRTEHHEARPKSPQGPSSGTSAKLALLNGLLVVCVASHRHLPGSACGERGARRWCRKNLREVAGGGICVHKLDAHFRGNH